MSTEVPRLMRGDHWSSIIARVAALQRRHRLLQHRLVQLEADLADMAGLLLAEQIAGAPDVEIVARQHEARAERVERLQHLEPLLGAPASAAHRRGW